MSANSLIGLFSKYINFQKNKAKFQNTVSIKDSMWLFFSASTDPHHLSDIVFGVSVLLQKGVAPTNILIVTDHPKANIHLTSLCLNIPQIGCESLIGAVKSIAGHKSIFFVSTGHGSHQGYVDFAGKIIKPHQIIEAFRHVPNLETVIFLLGQCYAGIFNYIEARGTPRMCVMGATNLHLSLSATIKLITPIKDSSGTVVLQSWLANIFLFSFFDWLVSPSDVDGDNKLSIADAFKYAGVKTNEQLRQIKKQKGGDIDRWLIAKKQSIIQQINALPAQNKNIVAPILEKAFYKSIDADLTLLYLHQEPWLMNAHLARELTISF